MIQTLSLDLETRSGTDLAKSGVYRYAEDPDFDILLFGVSIDGGPVTVYDLSSGEQLPDEFLTALTDDKVIKYAYNANFERICLSYWLQKTGKLQKGKYLSPVSWRCTMVWAAYNGLPFSLAQVGAVLGLEQQKMSEGKALIRFFCTPQNDGQYYEQISFDEQCCPQPARFHSPKDAPEKWELFKVYNRRDVETEMEIQERLKNHVVPDTVWEQYCTDQNINDLGIRIDQELVEQAIRMNEISQAKLTEKMKKLTGLENPNSVSQLKTYLEENGLKLESLGKKDVSSVLPETQNKVREVLELRLQSSKSSVKKYEAMKNAVCADGRCRGMFQFYGANRTGRWAGRLIQLQNLPQNKMEDLDSARELVKSGDYETLELLYASVPQVLSELIRTAFIPAPGKKFIVADFSAIEARVLAHLAGEHWREKVFAEGGDIYCESASKMFHVPVEKHGINGHLRQKGKVAELALGYGGSTGALKSMGALDMGLREDELKPLVDMWREANPDIVDYWWKIDEAAKKAITEQSGTKVGNLIIYYKSGLLFIELPSRRTLAYAKTKICENQFGGEGISYMGLNSQKKWERIETYGPKLVENITQAISRDILADAMKRLQNYSIVGHVHDELIIECNADTNLDTICEMMGRSPDWLPGIKLRADGYACYYYKKD